MTLRFCPGKWNHPTARSGGINKAGAKNLEIVILAVILLLAGALRVIVTWQHYHHPLFTSLRLDEVYNDQWAREAAAGSLFKQSMPISAPGYPWFLGAVYAVFGRNLLVPRILQVIMGLGSVLLAHNISRRLFGPAAALVSALLMALYWPLIVFEQRLLLATLFVVMNLFTLAAAIWSLDHDSIPGWISTGLGLGAMTVVYPTAVIWTIALAAWLAANAIKKRSRTSAFAATALAAGFLLLILPIVAMGQTRTGEWYFLRSHAGFNLYLGNNPAADGTMYARLGGGWDRIEALPVKEAGVITLNGQDRFYLAKVKQFIVQDPGDFFKLWARKSALILNRREIRATIDPEFHRSLFSALRLPLPGFALVLGLALAALASPAIQDRRRRLLALYLGSYAAAMISTVVASRYRLPLAAGLIICGGAGAVNLYSSLASLAAKKAGAGRRRNLAAPALFLAGIGLAFLPVAPKYSRAEEYSFLGLAYSQAGDNQAAMSYYRKALEADPRCAMAMTEIAALERGRGDLDSALAWQARSVAADPDGGYGHYDLGLYLWERGRREQAMEEFNRAVECKPLWEHALHVLAVHEYELGRLEAARQHFQTLLLVRPDQYLEIDSYLEKIETGLKSRR